MKYNTVVDFVKKTAIEFLLSGCSKPIILSSVNSKWPFNRA
jgi:hypothetical protein